ncbi:hypothetical protein BDV95DRAFT_563524 [Massariosphaeria phaeospora]|uniref:Uncharacterized protein n=1 Tax=Massariosphaeria phaeospora TaxID=100035 RepID=A0A7C8II38_9PLEO|nr:hypothetical protein BDV95DRAFT_563524 [Massariosphaeria phaeospora]
MQWGCVRWTRKLALYSSFATAARQDCRTLEYHIRCRAQHHGTDDPTCAALNRNRWAFVSLSMYSHAKQRLGRCNQRQLRLTR